MQHLPHTPCPRRLDVTDRIGWNEQSLSRRIRENETLVERLRAASDAGVVWIERHLEHDIDRRRRMLRRAQALDGSPTRDWLEAVIW